MSRVDFPLYLVTDRHQTLGRSLVPLVRDALAAGLRAVQLREKDLDTRSLLILAEEVHRLTQEHKALLLINDRIDVALAIGADGVHLRSDSLPVVVARRLLGRSRLLGVSVHSPEAATQAADDGADFVVLGPIYDTPSKRIYGSPLGLGPLDHTTRRSSVPVFAIGGMTAAHVADVRRAGAHGVAVISAILSAEDVAIATRTLLDAFATSV